MRKNFKVVKTLHSQGGRVIIYADADKGNAFFYTVITDDEQLSSIAPTDFLSAVLEALTELNKMNWRRNTRLAKG